MKKTLFLSAILGAVLCSSAFGAVTNMDIASWSGFSADGTNAVVGGSDPETVRVAQDWNTNWSFVFSVDTSTMGADENLTLAGILLHDRGSNVGYAEGAKMAGNTTAQLTSWSNGNQEQTVDFSQYSNVTFVISRDTNGNFMVKAYDSASDFSTALVTLTQGGQKFSGYDVAGITFGGQGAYSKFKNNANATNFLADSAVGSFTITNAGYTLGSIATTAELQTFVSGKTLAWQGGEGDAGVLSAECTNWTKADATNAATDTLHFGTEATSHTVTVNSVVSAATICIADDYTFSMGNTGKINGAISVADGKVLTIDSIGASATWANNLYGSGTLKYTGTTQMSFTGDLLTAAKLEGTRTGNAASNLVFKGGYRANISLKNVDIAEINAREDAASITLDGVRGYFAKNGNMRTVTLTGNGMTLTNGWIDQGFTIATLKGNGTLARDSSAYAANQNITISDATGWTGVYNNGGATTTLTVNSATGRNATFEIRGTLNLNLNGNSYSNIKAYAGGTGNVKITNNKSDVTIYDLIQDAGTPQTGKINVELNTANRKTNITHWMTVNSATLKSNSSLQVAYHNIGTLNVEAGSSTLQSGAAIGSGDHRVGTINLNDNADLTVTGGNNNATITSLSLGGGSTITLGSKEEGGHNYLLTLQDLTVGAAEEGHTTTINANLKVTGTMDFTSGGVLTMGCSVELGDDVTVTLSADAYDYLANRTDGDATAVTLFNSVEGYTGSNIIHVVGTGAEQDGWFFLNYTPGEQGGTLSLVPEPATATLSLLALAALAARRRRH